MLAEKEKELIAKERKVMEKVKKLLEDKKLLPEMIADFMTIAEYKYQLALEKNYPTFSKREKAIKIGELREEKKS